VSSESESLTEIPHLMSGLSSPMSDDERGKVALEVINWLLSDMVVNNAYEYDGKPMYDGLTSQHIDYVLAEFRGEHKPNE